MKPTKEFLEWSKILLDTSTILDYLKIGSADSTVDDRIKFTKKLIDFLVDSKTSTGKERIFLISSISLSEIRALKQDTDIYKEIIYALNASNVEIIPFDRRLALYMNSIIGNRIDKKNLNAKITQLFTNNAPDYVLAPYFLDDFFKRVC